MLQQGKQPFVDISAPSTFSTADRLRSKRDRLYFARGISTRSSRSEEHLLPSSSSKSYAGPLKTTSVVASKSAKSPKTERSSGIAKTEPRPPMPASSSEMHLLAQRTSRVGYNQLPRPIFRDSPTSSTSNGGDSSSGILPLTPRDGSETSARKNAHRKSSSVTFAIGIATKSESKIDTTDEVKRRERRRSEAKNAIAVCLVQPFSFGQTIHCDQLGNVVNGPGPVDSDEDEGVNMRQNTNTGMQMQMQLPSTSQFTPNFADAWSNWARQSMTNTMQMSSSQQQTISNTPQGVDMKYYAAHRQAMMIAKQTYQMAVAQQAMAAAGEDWERSSNVSGMPGWGGGSVIFPTSAQSAYGGSVLAANSTYGGGWGSHSVYGENFGPSLSRGSIAGQPVPPSSFLHSTAKEGMPRQRARSGAQDGLTPPTSWKRR